MFPSEASAQTIPRCLPATAAILLAAALLCLPGSAFPQSPAADKPEQTGVQGEAAPAANAAADQSEDIDAAVADAAPVDAQEPVVPPGRLPWNERIDRFEADDQAFVADRENPDELYAELTALLEMRARQFDLILDEASSRGELADPQIQVLASTFPLLDADLYPFPNGVMTVQQVHENLLALYEQRVRLFEYASGELRASITGTEIAGMRELFFESRLIWLELRYQVLRFPDAVRLLVQMTTRAPVALLEFLVRLLLLVVVFRWWRRWFPETMQRMRSYLLAIKPRTLDIVRRMRGIWYIERVRKPIEWLLFFNILIGLLDFLDLEFISDVSLIIIRWVFVTWFVVALLDAIVARGAGGAASEIGQTRRKSFRLIATWLVLLGLGLNLADRLTGDVALYAWIWRIFKLLALPLVFVLLGMWREELFLRVRLQDREFMARTEFEAHKGLAKYIEATKLVGFLVTAWLRNRLLRRLERLDPGRTVSTEEVTDHVRPGDEKTPVDVELRARFLGESIAYQRYGRSERARLLGRINEGVGGAILVIGERGIGKEMFTRQLCEDAEQACLSVDCREGTAASVQRQLAEGLGISGSLDDKDAIAAAIEAKGIGILLVTNVHFLVRPVMHGLEELLQVAETFDLLPSHVAEVMSMDRYAWQYVKCGLAERAASIEVVPLPAWTEEQIHGLIEVRCEEVDLQPDFSRVRVPSQYLSSGGDSTRDRNRKGIYAMAAALSGGNPSIALRLFVDCLSVDKRGKLIAGLPENQPGRSVDQAPLHVLLVLRVIAQSEYINHDHIVANLRYPKSVVDNGIKYALAQRWITEKNGLYTLTWPWFYTVTRVLSRQNLLAGVREEVQ